jgi:Xaa-Pro aminopeptidase
MKNLPLGRIVVGVCIAFVFSSLIFAAGVPALAQDFDQATYRARRDRLAKLAGEGIVIVQSVPENQPGITEYFINHSDNHDFLYLTGVQSKKASLVLLPQSRAYPELLFVPEEQIEKAQAISGVKIVLSEEKLSVLLSEALTDLSLKRITERLHKPVSTEMARIFSLSPKKDFYINYPRFLNLNAEPPSQLKLAARLQSFSPNVEIKNASPLLTKLRVRHDKVELETIKKAVEIGSQGLIAAMKACRPGAYDYQVDALVEFEFKNRGASSLAYPSLTYISAFTRPSKTLSAAELKSSSEPMSAIHQMESGDLVMLDSGAEYHHYATDLSRTIPVSGNFNPEQRELYDAVLAAHHAAIAEIRPGATFKQIHDAALAPLKKKGIDQYFTFGIGHFIGMDAHDPGDYEEPLEPGMIITVEPGIINTDKNITVHVEDMILVTEQGHEVLSASVPIEIADIEKLLFPQ